MDIVNLRYSRTIADKTGIYAYPETPMDVKFPEDSVEQRGTLDLESRNETVKLDMFYKIGGCHRFLGFKHRGGNKNK